MIEDRHLLDAWYHYAAKTPGFIGAALRTQRGKAFMTQEQQRNLLGISHERYDHAWLHLQAMPLPRTDQFLTDLERIMARVMGDQSTTIVHLKHLEDLILAGLQ